MAAHTLVLKNATKDILMETDLPVSLTSTDVLAFMGYLDAMIAAISGLNFVEFKPLPLPETDWLYRFKAGTRVWKQIVTLAPLVNDYAMTFQVPDKWQLDEFTSNRAVRDWLFNCVIQYQMKSFRMDVL